MREDSEFSDTFLTNVAKRSNIAFLPCIILAQITFHASRLTHPHLLSLSAPYTISHLYYTNPVLDFSIFTARNRSKSVQIGPILDALVKLAIIGVWVSVGT